MFQRLSNPSSNPSLDPRRSRRLGINEDGLTALHHASSRGQNLAIGILLKASAILGNMDINQVVVGDFSKDTKTSKSRTQKAGWSALHFAAQGGHLDTIRLLISRGASIQAKEVPQSPSL